MATRAGGLKARIRNDSQKIRSLLTTAAEDPQRSAAMRQNVYRTWGELQTIHHVRKWG